jgi:hypothetical protein
MSVQLKVIADSTSAVAMGSGADTFRGLAGFLNEDEHNDCKVAFVAEGEPTAADLARLGAWLGAGASPQIQVQDMGTGFDASRFFVICEPFVLSPGVSIPAKSDIHTPKNTIHAYLAEGFTLPNLNDTVDVVVKESLGISADSFIGAVGEYAGREANLGVFIGGVFFDLVAIVDSTHMTIRNRGLPGAVVSVIG